MLWCPAEGYNAENLRFSQHGTEDETAVKRILLVARDIWLVAGSPTEAKDRQSYMEYRDRCMDFLVSCRFFDPKNVGVKNRAGNALWVWRFVQLEEEVFENLLTLLDAQKES